jgi:cell division protein FtsQ
MDREPKIKPRHAPEPAAHFTRNRVVVIGASLLAMLFAAALVWVVMATLPKKWDAAQMLPIRDVTFVGDMTRVDASELKRIAGGIRGSMLRTDLAEVKAAVKKIQWVRDADVRRRFPSTLEVSIEEHQPYAHWKSTESEKRSVVNTRGEVFKADLDAPLPIFSGPPGTSKEVLASHSAFTTQLAAVGRVPTELSLSARRAWQIKLDNGTSLELGRSEAAERLSRYVKAYPVVAALQLANARVDMRYQAGIAVRAAIDGTAKKTTNKS